MSRQTIRTQDELARQAGVSRVTVNRALAGSPLVNPETRERVSELARKLGYRPNAMARAMVSRRSHIAGLVMMNTVVPGTELNNQPWFEVIMGADVALREAGYTPALIGVDEVCPPEGAESRALRERLADGVVLLGNLPPDVDRRIVAAMEDRIVRAEANRWDSRMCIRRDEVAAGRLVAEALLRAGRRPLIWVGNAEPSRAEHFSSAERREGFLAAATEAAAAVREVSLERDAGADARSVFARTLPQGAGVGCVDAVLARLLTDAAAPFARFPGRDFGLACCDDSQMIAQFFPTLARARFDRYALGRQAAQMLLRRIESPDAPCPSCKVSGDFHVGATL